MLYGHMTPRHLTSTAGVAGEQTYPRPLAVACPRNDKEKLTLLFLYSRRLGPGSRLEAGMLRRPNSAGVT